jgi:8-oxo-dGTP pyrophosphatase MutT (NUDIX family)
VAIVPKDLGEPINGINIVRSNMDTGSVTIAYRIGKAWWRKGYTSEAFATVIKFLFEEVGVNRIEATHPQENPNSGKVMAKCGLKYEGTLRQAGKNNQGVFDELCYAILAEDYFGASKPPQSYIMNLRKYVGHIPLIMNGAGVIIENERGEILLGRRRDNDCWTHAGGSTELGESCEDTARRELFEEMGLIANTLELLGVFSGKDTHYIYPNGDEVYNVAVNYTCRDWSGTPSLQEAEVAELRWFPIDDLPSNIPPPDMTVYRAYLEKR